MSRKKLKRLTQRMASDEHLQHSDYIKSVHKSLRDETKRLGDPELAWKQHLENIEALTRYSDSMRTLSEDHWNKNKESSQNRINWTVTVCLEYFSTELQRYREKEQQILDVDFTETEHQTHKPVPCYRRLTESSDNLRLLDVGSCFNPFKKYSEFDVTAIDIAPSKSSDVFKADFLDVRLSEQGTEVEVCHNRLMNLPRNYFDCVVFSLLLEYLPTSTQRLICVKKAYEVLDNEGILVIITPDSKHIGANAKLMKNWRFTLALQGFNRIKIEKLQHVTCMVFRKCVHPNVSLRWARKYKEPYMNEELNIPQDFNLEAVSNLKKDLEEYQQIKEAAEDVNFLHELPNFS